MRASWPRAGVVACAAATPPESTSAPPAAAEPAASAPPHRRRRRRQQDAGAYPAPDEPVEQQQQQQQQQQQHADPSPAPEPAARARAVRRPSSAAAASAAVLAAAAPRPAAAAAAEHTSATAAAAAAAAGADPVADGGGGGGGDDDEDLFSGDLFDSGDGDLFGDGDDDDDEPARQAAARLSRFLDFRERGALETLTKLRQQGAPPEVARRALLLLQRQGLQDDARFALMYARAAWRTKAQAPARVAYELRARGVSQADADAALEAVFGASRRLVPGEAPRRRRHGDDGGDDVAYDDGGSSDGDERERVAWGQLLQACERRAELSSHEPPLKRRAKLAQWLQRRGHPLSLAFRVFDALGI